MNGFCPKQCQGLKALEAHLFPDFPGVPLRFSLSVRLLQLTNEKSAQYWRIHPL